MNNGTLYINGEKIGEVKDVKLTVTRIPEKGAACITIKRERSTDDEIIAGDKRQ